MDRSGKLQTTKLIASLAICYAAAAIGGIASATAGSFYDSLKQPKWAPPGWVFGPVWTSLYTMMGLATWLVWRKATTRAVALGLSVFCIQLTCNALWSWLFFQWQLGAAAFADIVVLLALIIANVAIYWKYSKLAGLLLLPYLAWVSFAAALCYSVWQMNSDALAG